eukprot:TRINITY_DN7025_c0_g1_i1.p1 TRINITY_DN7025_c0_g1~~TRINITY_DN7025_c0_g1_i1.p1  ORF type:complete len:547 (-),score=88.52 TRINITY_DN7025_c0_g1_i1:206-1846(-)
MECFLERRKWFQLNPFSTDNGKGVVTGAEAAVDESPIERLPNDRLIDILELASRDASDNRLGWLRVRLVCKKWKEIFDSSTKFSHLRLLFVLYEKQFFIEGLREEDFSCCWSSTKPFRRWGLNYTYRWWISEQETSKLQNCFPRNPGNVYYNQIGVRWWRVVLRPENVPTYYAVSCYLTPNKKLYHLEFNRFKDVQWDSRYSTKCLASEPSIEVAASGVLFRDTLDMLQTEVMEPLGVSGLGDFLWRVTMQNRETSASYKHAWITNVVAIDCKPSRPTKVVIIQPVFPEFGRPRQQEPEVKLEEFPWRWKCLFDLERELQVIFMKAGIYKYNPSDPSQNMFMQSVIKMWSYSWLHLLNFSIYSHIDKSLARPLDVDLLWIYPMKKGRDVYDSLTPEENKNKTFNKAHYTLTFGYKRRFRLWFQPKATRWYSNSIYVVGEIQAPKNTKNILCRVAFPNEASAMLFSGRGVDLNNSNTTAGEGDGAWLDLFSLRYKAHWQIHNEPVLKMLCWAARIPPQELGLFVKNLMWSATKCVIPKHYGVGLIVS